MIEEEEIKTLKKMKMKEAAEIDSIPMEAWRYAKEELWITLIDSAESNLEERDITEGLEEKCCGTTI